MKRTVHAHRVNPPIPTDRFDWCATLEGYEPGDPIGRGPTKQAAIDDLLEQWSDDSELEITIRTLEAMPAHSVELCDAVDQLQAAIDGKGRP